MCIYHDIFVASIGLHLQILSYCIFHMDGLVQDCSNSSALAMELLQFCAKPYND